MDLELILQRCREGDELAWEALVREYQGRIYAVAYHLLGNPEDARDTAQEIFIRIYRNLHVCRDAQWFVPWAIRIARNVCIDQLRRRKARPPAQDLDAEEMRDLPVREPDPEQSWLEASNRRLVRKALLGLTALNREIIVLRDIQALPLEEIARMLNVPLGTVKSRCNRARIELAGKVRELLRRAVPAAGAE